MSHTNLVLGGNWHHDEWPEFVDVGHDGASDSKIYVSERTCKRVDIYSLFFREHYKGCSVCHNPLDVLDRYCSRCGAKVII